MGLLDKFKKSTKKENYQSEEISGQGWDAITSECERVYPCLLYTSRCV